ncbi:MAG: hypothetical protein EKK42_33745 [Pseudonocardiaceae bacterium]|nr:MAG: hypothetical protein EKK42_33745 [Pseudonocardiaceae bacterium]
MDEQPGISRPQPLVVLLVGLAVIAASSVMFCCSLSESFSVSTLTDANPTSSRAVHEVIGVGVNHQAGRVGSPASNTTAEGRSGNGSTDAYVGTWCSHISQAVDVAVMGVVVLLTLLALRGFGVAIAPDVLGGLRAHRRWSPQWLRTSERLAQLCVLRT